MNFQLLFYCCLFLLPCSLLLGLYVSEGVNVFTAHKHTVRDFSYEASCGLGQRLAFIGS